MYSIVKDGAEIGMTERPAYIRLQANGAYALCDQQDAQGICYDGTVYHIWGLPEIAREGVESVALVEFDAGKLIREQRATIDALIGADAATPAETAPDTLPNNGGDAA